MSKTAVPLGLALSVAAALAACSAPPRTADRDRPGEGFNQNLTVTPRTLALAEQAQRDVEQLRALGDPAAETSRPSGPPKIDWILPQANRPARVETEPAVAARESTKSSSPPIVQEPLAGATTHKTTPPPSETAAADEPGGGLAAHPGNDSLRQEIVRLSASLYREAAYSDMPLRELLLIAATALVTPDRALATDAIPGLTDRERELLDHLQAFFARLGRALADEGDPEAIAAEVAALHKALATQPRLTLPRAVLCSRVGGFGDFDEFSLNPAGRYSFLAHNGQQAVVYVEVEDFTSELNEKSQWVTELSQQLVIYSDRDGIPVWREDWQAGVDASKNHRDDFFIVQLITLPQRLSVGRYQLKLHIRDEKSGAEAETAIDFEMVADPRMAGN